MTIFICGDTKSQQATEHLMQSENILLFKIERIFLRFSSVFSLFLPPPPAFSRGKVVLAKGQCHVRSRS